MHSQRNADIFKSPTVAVLEILATETKGLPPMSKLADWDVLSSFNPLEWLSVALIASIEGAIRAREVSRAAWLSMTPTYMTLLIERWPRACTVAYFGRERKLPGASSGRN